MKMNLSMPSQSVHNPDRAARNATLLGLVAILLWSSSVAVCKSLQNQLGPMTAAAMIYTTAGAIGLAAQLLARRKRPQAWRSIPPAYWLGGGFCFILYYFGFFTALGWASNSQQVMEMTLINYLWPGLTLALSVPILRRRARPWLIPGMLLTLSGVALGLLQQNGRAFSSELLVLNIKTHWAPYLVMAIAAFAWAMYSNLSRKFSSTIDGSTLPFFLLGTGLAMMPLRYLFHETTVWTARAAGEFIFIALFVALLANMCWSVAMRRGNITLVSLAAYFTPLIAILINGLYLHIGIGLNLWVAGVLVVVGALLCKVSIVEPAR
ncbi:MAG: aromatic amino acid DMT transporter YddG [Kiritimatiellaeota bacterium]|nr:aromatic amino acid DMT transporter YddG [Kiritimatiellota bacterium]